MGPTTPAPGTAPSSPVSVLTQLLAQRYPQLDPKAVLAVAQQEGLSGGIGDGGHAFGPFQLNNAGGVLTGRFVGQTPQQINQWAWSPDGLNDALQHIVPIAAGLHGRQAVANIVSRFERPANVSGEIARADAALGGVTPQQFPAAFAQSPPAGSPVAAALATPVKPLRPGGQRSASPLLKLALQILNS